MPRRFRPPCRPPWWPHNEPWPAAPRFAEWPGRRSRFFRRIAFTALAVLTLSVTGAVALVWLAATTWGWIAPSASRSAAVLAAAALVGVGLAIVGLVGVMRRVAMPLGGVMDAADRVAAGNYDVRVVEHGPPSIRALARAFNTITARLQDSDRLRRDVMGDIAHHLGNRLTDLR